MYEHSPVLTKYKQRGIHYKKPSKRNLSPAGGVTFNVGAGQDKCRRDSGARVTSERQCAELNVPSASLSGEWEEEQEGHASAA